ncbi:MAG: hypothetical protein ACRELV_11840 [Longimicrobiales bacterium]
MHRIVRRLNATRPLAITSLAALSVAVLAGCGHHHLEDYAFPGRSLATVYSAPATPVLWTGDYDVDTTDPLLAVFDAGARVAREVEGRRARARLDSAATRFDLAERMADRTVQRAARYLGATPSAEPHAADFLLEVFVESYGIDARGDRAPSLFVEGEAVLIDARSGDEIWNREVRAWDRLGPGVRQDSPAGEVSEEILGLGALGSVSVDEFETLLLRLADYTADVITNDLRADLRDVRDERRGR